MRLVYVMVFFNGCSGCLCSDDEPEPSSSCGAPCTPGQTRQCSCGCYASGTQVCIASGEWGSCMCESIPHPPDARFDAALDATFDATFDADADLDAELDGSTDAFRPSRDAASDGDEPDGIPWLPMPTDPPSHADAWRLRVSSATAPADRAWDADGTPPDLRVDIESRAGVILQTSVVTDSYRAEFTDDTSVRVSVTEPLRFVLRDVDELTPTGPLTEVVLECTPRVTDEIRADGGALRCRNDDATIQVEAEALVRGD